MCPKIELVWFIAEGQVRDNEAQFGLVVAESKKFVIRWSLVWFDKVGEGQVMCNEVELVWFD